MKKHSLSFLAGMILVAFMSFPASAHFGMLIPSDTMIEQGGDSMVNLELMFAHPFEGNGMDMERPLEFAVVRDGQKTDLLSTLEPADIMGHKAWETKYRIKRPGVYTFYAEPRPYWEPSEDCYIVHYTKVIVEAYGLEAGWDRELGLKTEIVPLSRPFGLYTGNVFQGIVKLEGKPCPFAEIEVEYYNKARQYHAPAGCMVTQVIRADKNGVFTYAAPKAGWWGFAALNTADKKIEKNGKQKDVEIGAVIWVRFCDMK
ncbi:MAG: DUF4198 domain-containing protein [Thermodesulfobacteriota bacterium]|nr:DUF4198 domain-containing protein [Thermodesulfobacteriota bacterium]